MSIRSWLTPRTVHAHCDLPCGVYDPAQARIEAESVKAIQQKYAELVKHHLWVLWTDYFKPEHLDKHPNLHQLFWDATKEAGAAKRSNDPNQGQKLLDLINEIDKTFWDTKK